MTGEQYCKHSRITLVAKVLTKRSLVVFLALAMTVGGIPTKAACALWNDTVTDISIESAQEQIDALEELVPASATACLETDLNAIREVANDTFEDVIIVGDISLGQPYVVYDVTANQQDEIYSYPIIDDETGDVVLVADVIGTTEGWTYGVSREMVEELNEVDYLNRPCLFYNDGNCIVSDDLITETIVCGEKTPAIEFFSGQSFDNKIGTVETAVESMQKVDVQTAQECDSEVVLDGYSPGLTITSTGKYCDLYYRRGQGKWNLCWAASAATIINYRKGTNYFATRVADKMGVGYDDKAPYTTVKKTLQAYGCTSYDYAKEQQLSWAKIKANIGKKKPIYASCPANDEKSSHGVTVFGYKKADGVKYVKIWNSAINNGGGDTQIFKYKSSGTTIKSGSIAYTWTRSVYAVNSTD